MPSVTTLLLHGFTGSSQSWDEGLVDGLASSGRPPVLVDLPGHGRHVGDTDPRRFTLEHVFEVIADAAGGQVADLVGYSMGGRMALAYAATFPHRVGRLVLESASPGLATEVERTGRRASDDALAGRLVEGGIEAFVDFWEGLPLFESQGSVPAHVLARQRGRRLLNDPQSLAASLRGLGTGSQPSYWEVLPTLSVPTLLMVGESDARFVEIAREMVADIPDARLAVVAGAGHAVHLERPDAWLSEVTAFLASGRSS